MSRTDEPLPPSEAPTANSRPLLRHRLWIPIVLSAAVGVFTSVGTFTFGYAGGASYLSDDPKACANCHVMQEHYDSWQHSGHRHVAVCNDCHLPPHPITKWVTKADNGLFHSLAFTTGNYPKPLQIKARNAKVTQSACVACHRDLADNMHPAEPNGEPLNCVHCHADVGHALKGRRGAAINR